MKFAYAGFISPAAETGEEVIIFRPEVPLRIHGANGSATYMALVDTGADNTMLPLSIAHELSIATYKAEGPNATAFGGLIYARTMRRFDGRLESISLTSRILSQKPLSSAIKVF